MRILKLFAALMIAALAAAAAQAGVVRYDCNTPGPHTPISGHLLLSVDFSARTATMQRGSEVRTFRDITITPGEISWSEDGGYRIDRNTGEISWVAPSVHTVSITRGQCTISEKPAAQARREFYLCWGTSDHWPMVLIAVTLTPESGGDPGRVDVIGDPTVGGLQQPYSGPISHVDGAVVQWEFPAGSFWLDRNRLSLWGGVTKVERKSELAPMRCRKYSIIG